MKRLIPLAALAAGTLLPSLAAAQSMTGMPGMDHGKMATPAGTLTPKPKSKPKPKPKPLAVAKPSAAARSAATGIQASHVMAPAPAPMPPESVPPDDAMAAHPDLATDQNAIDHHGHGMVDMPGMYAAKSMSHGGSVYVDGSGTSRLPANEGAMHGLHLTAGDWMLMLHGYAWTAYTDQGGQRGGQQAFVTSMMMVSASHDLAPDVHLKLQSMLSLEPLMGPRGYPNLFATGETANGVTPLIDRQHPHDLFMELSARLDVDMGSGGASVYAAPVGEPALGPAAFMHRASAQYQTLSPITHHWFDSTHISYGVLTAGYAAPHWQIEASAFRGREPDEHRWDIKAPALNSWSVRATWSPSAAWAVEISHAFLKSPEQLEPDNNERRTVASVQYAKGGLATTFAFSAKDKGPGRTLTAWLAEANWNITRHHSIFGRAENVANDELFPDAASPLHGQRFRVGKIEGGYAYRLPLAGPVGIALGGSVAGYVYPAALDAAYGQSPVSYTLFAKLSLGH